MHLSGVGRSFQQPDGVDILPALKREDSHGTVPLVWDGYGL